MRPDTAAKIRKACKAVPKAAAHALPIVASDLSYAALATNDADAEGHILIAIARLISYLEEV